MERLPITLVVARAQNGVIGRGGKLPWHLPADLKRRHIVLTHDRGWSGDGAEVAHSVAQALQLAGAERVSVIGGAKVFALFMPLADRIELTEVLADIEGDISIPDPRALGNWRETWSEERAAEDGRPPFRFVTLERA